MSLAWRVRLQCHTDLLCLIVQIATLNGLPPRHLSFILAHELCHAFMHLHRFPHMEDAVVEGVCELWGHMYLQHCIKQDG